MIDLSAAVYCRIAELRLTEARSKCERFVAQDNIEYVASFAQTASLIWDAAMDVLSALVMLEGGEPTGRSSDLRQYVRARLPENHYRYWRRLSLLHNFQHKPNLPEARFRQAIHHSGIFLTLLNERFPSTLQLDPGCFDWLTRSGDTTDTIF